MTIELKKPGRPKVPGLEARRQAEILTAAAKAFAAHGFANTDVQAIADDLGIGKGLVPSRRGPRASGPFRRD
jgi:AcrR family transcriptional regulator